MVCCCHLRGSVLGRCRGDGGERLVRGMSNAPLAEDVRRPSPSSLRYENQIEVRLPPAALRVVLGNQLLIAGRPHPNVDVGWPAAVGDGHVALQAVPSSLAGKHSGPVCIVVVPLGLASQNSILALRTGLHSSAARTLPESTYPLPTLIRTGAPGS